MTAQDIISELQAEGSTEKAAHLARFFKTGKGQYGEGDRFLGISVPIQRTIVKKYILAPHSVLKELLASPWHEARLTALLILLQQFEKNKDEIFRASCVEFYLAQTLHINNWDLVDTSCYKLLGVWLKDKDRQILYQLAHSSNMWEQRIAMVTCMCFVRQGDFKDCLNIADLLLNHPHDLIHKSVGWLIREVGKKDRQTLVDFLASRYQKMPRTMLRYAIEHFPDAARKKYLQKTGCVARVNGLI